MLMDAQRACLLVVDIQEKLAPVIDAHHEVIEHTSWLLGVAGELEVPVIASRQYPKWLGPLVPELGAHIPVSAQIDKLHFSCAAAPECRAAISRSGRTQIVITGVEAHVCVLQSALGLKQAGYEVFVVGEAVSSRRVHDRVLALERLRAHGVDIVNREMVAFEWLQQAGTDKFRTISKRYIR